MKEFNGIPVSPGIAVATAFVYDPKAPQLPRYEITPDKAGAEIRRFEEAASRAKAGLMKIKDSVPSGSASAESLMVDSQIAMSDDPEWRGRVAEEIRGERIVLTDNAKYCTFARFCHPAGDVWTLTEHSDDPASRKLAVREASMCPGGRLTAWDRETGKPYEFRFEPSLGLIEDEAIGSSGGLWVRGGIPLRREDGRVYEIRNRMVLCRCGQSANKPYCDGTHAAVKWRDRIDGQPVGETLPEEVY